MLRRNQKWLTLLAVVGLAYWCFGNVYEAVVFAPNWVVDSAEQIRRLNEFFVRTSPTSYFIPVTVLPILLVGILFAVNRDARVQADYRRAGVFALLSVGITVFMVSTFITRMFGAGYAEHAAGMAATTWGWSISNLFRIAFVATTASFMFAAFRKLDRPA